MRTSYFTLTICLSLFASPNARSDVKLVQGEAGFHLERNGAKFDLKGVGGDQHLGLLSSLGGNAIRTWGADNLGTVLDDAHKHGLVVCAGIWLGHQRHGFSYKDKAAVQRQFDQSIQVVREYKDHPALLMWGIGNEMEGEGNDPDVWNAVNAIARAVKEVDPNHPTMTVIAELGHGESKVKNIEKFCPAIDIVGVNSYGGIGSVADRYRSSGCGKPFIVTEHGTSGPWEVGKTPWGSPLEKSSTEKGREFASGYESAVVKNRDICLGSFAFLWGNKQETTATWFGMLLPDGTRLSAADAMVKQWTGKAPKNQCPQITSVVVDRDRGLKPGDTIEANVVVEDADSDECRVEWILRSDAGTIGEGGDPQSAEAAFRKAVSQNGKQATIVMPSGGGAYRLFVYVYDGQGGAAVANVPLYMPVEMKLTNKPSKVRLPYAVYDEATTSSAYIPSGYMGNAGAVKMNLECKENPYEGETCIKAEYNAVDSWGGVLWQSPAGDWDGVQPGGADVSDATQLEFWARGASGGEVVNFVFGVLDRNRAFPDTAKGELKNVVLGKEWKRYSFPLKGLDLRQIKTGFGWSLAGQKKNVAFYLDRIQFVE